MLSFPLPVTEEDPLPEDAASLASGRGSYRELLDVGLCWMHPCPVGLHVRSRRGCGRTCIGMARRPRTGRGCRAAAPRETSGHPGNVPLTAQDAQVHALLDRVLTTFTDSGVAWALLRGRSELGTRRDVDLLVAAAHLPVAEEIVFELGGVPLPQRRYPWHRMHVLEIPGAGPNLQLDIVDHLIYSRELQIASDLERGCLERRRRDGLLFLLSPTDAFWTILLHCVLDKRHVREDRADELLSFVDDLESPSPGEEFFETLCPPGWSAEQAVECVERRDWQPLGSLGERILSLRMAETSTPDASDPIATNEAPRRLVDKVVRRASRVATGAVYRKGWRALGLGVIPDIFDFVEEALVDATVIELRRRPGRCDVVLVVEDRQLQRLLPVMRLHYRPLAGVWRRFKAFGLECVRLVPASELSLAEHPNGEPREPSLLLPGRRYCRLALSPPGQGGAEGERDA